MKRSLKTVLLGKPLLAQDMHHECLDKRRALAIFSSDALSSVAYATEAILIELLFVGTIFMDWSMIVAIAIIGLLVILILSYRQTIHLYPNGGGAYIVAKENLGETPGLVAAGALMMDYLLTVSVSISAGVEALTSAFPQLHSSSVSLGLLAILLITLGNLRGMQESAKIFAIPPYVFIFSILALIGTGIYKLAAGELVTQPISEVVRFSYEPLGLFMILKAFSAGCTALTGVEAVSNGVPVFKNPKSHNAVVTLSWMAGLLGIMFIGITFLAHALHILPSDTETVLSQIARATFGTTFFYYLIQVSTTAILLLAANTAYAGFPRLASLLALDRFLPRQFTSLGDRLVFSNGIIVLGFLAGFLIVIFGGDTHLLLPLYAVGVFVSFSLSQSGMVVRYWRKRPKHWGLSLSINLIGAITTLTVLGVIAVTRFVHGAWLVIILIPLMVIMFKKINLHYKLLGLQLTANAKDFVHIHEPLNMLVLIPVSGVHKGITRAIRFASTISKDVVALSINTNPESTARLKADWAALELNIPLVVLDSPFRSLSDPLIKYISEKIDEFPRKEREVVLVIPEFVTARWWHGFLHNQTAVLIRTYLWWKYPELVVTNVRHRLRF